MLSFVPSLLIRCCVFVVQSHCVIFTISSPLRHRCRTITVVELPSRRNCRKITVVEPSCRRRHRTDTVKYASRCRVCHYCQVSVASLPYSHRCVGVTSLSYNHRRRVAVVVQSPSSRPHVAFCVVAFESTLRRRQTVTI